MKVLVYDFEVFKHDWLVVFSDTDGKNIKVVANDNNALKRIMLQNGVIFAGFNNKSYDDNIAQVILMGGSNEDVKACNDWIIGGNNGFEFPLIQGQRKLFHSFDLRSDIPDMGLSLKAIEGNINLPIVESSIPFDTDRKLTPEELDEVIYYCKHDVASTVKLYHLRKSYLEGKIAVGKLKGWDETRSLPPTNPKLTAMFLDAKLKDYGDEFEYTPPKGLILDGHEDILDFYKNIDYSKKMEVELAGIPHTFAWGGLHGSVEHYQDESTDEWKIVDIDVGSYYPSLMLRHNYVSRGIPSAEGYADIYERRLRAKHEGSKEEAAALKLVLNSTYGAMKNGVREFDKNGERKGRIQFANPLYDPKMANHICISGQLFLTDLILKFMNVPSFKLIQSNTDGLMIKYHIDDEKQIQAIVKDWQNRSLMTMEWKLIKKIACMKDVNNYILVEGETWLVNEDGSKTVTDPDKNKITTKGGWSALWNGGSFRNNSLVIVHKALVDFFVHGTPPEETINKATNIFDFQMICKRGSTYNQTVRVVNGEDIEVQKVNRVYATKDPQYGTLYKVKEGRRDKIADIPANCIVDNTNLLKLEEVDKQFYIDLANKRIKDYIGEKTPKEKKRRDNMATKLNLMQKLNRARLEFLLAKPKKSGMNPHRKFKYFTLDDIVPVALSIFDKYGLFVKMSFDDKKAIATVFDVEASGEQLTFSFDLPANNTDHTGNPEIQVIGCNITYSRRYLWLIVLDICEADLLDAELGKPEPNEESNTEAVKVEHSVPKTKEERKEAVAVMTTSDMTELQKKSIVNAMKKLRTEKPSDANEKFIASITAKIKAFKNGQITISNKEAEDILLEIGEKLKVEE